ncbi:hypothetical protein E2C01_096295 [Portunus trituberculatus]|uniref:Uncharacterized protein n=1 Tax=Portunus trituberculatus TaxID=210409 RepID=A0A5B7K7V3_PORTR|nr:hypothetical protein [Portunus trituberculatus]
MVSPRPCASPRGSLGVGVVEALRGGGGVLLRILQATHCSYYVLLLAPPAPGEPHQGDPAAACSSQSLEDLGGAPERRQRGPEGPDHSGDEEDAGEEVVDEQQAGDGRAAGVGHVHPAAQQLHRAHPRPRVEYGGDVADGRQDEQEHAHRAHHREHLRREVHKDLTFHCYKKTRGAARGLPTPADLHTCPVHYWLAPPGTRTLHTSSAASPRGAVCGCEGKEGRRHHLRITFTSAALTHP